MIEPELLGPTPRKVVACDKIPTGWILGCGAFAFIFVAAGLFGLTIAIHKTVVRSFGTVVPARITGTATRSDDSITSSVPISYTVKGQEYQSKVGIDHASANMLQIGGPVEVKVLPSTPSSHVMLVGNTAGDSEINFMWLWAGLWNAFLWIPISLVLWGKRRMKRVAMYGKPVTGRVTEKKVMAGESSDTHYVYYAFRPHTGSDGEITSRESVNKEQYESIQVGDQYTVLYLESKPKINSLYRFGWYRVA